MRLLQECLRSELKQELESIKKKNPRYSIRAMSRALKMSSGTLTDFLNKKRVFSFSKIEKLLASTEMRLPKSRDLVKTLKESGQLNKDAVFEYYPTHERVIVKDDQYSMIIDWVNFALLSLAETTDFRSDVEWIANRLDLAPARIKESLERLLRLQLLTGEDIHNLKSTGKSFASPDGAPCEAVRNSQIENLDLARSSLHRDPVELRDFYSMTMAIDPSKLEEAKRRTRIFMDSLCDLLEEGERKEVYQAQFQLFPLSRRS